MRKYDCLGLSQPLPWYSALVNLPSILYDRARMKLRSPDLKGSKLEEELNRRKELAQTTYDRLFK